MYTIFGNEEVSNKDSLLLCYQLIEYFVSALEKRKSDNNSDEVDLDHGFELNLIGKILHEKHISIYKDEYEPLVAKIDFTKSDVIDFCKRVSKKISTEEKNKWWTERDFVFDGVSCTEYMWPRDREICFTNPSNKNDKVLSPIFSIAKILKKENRNVNEIEIQKCIEENVASTIKSLKEQNNRSYYIHLVKIIGMPELCAIFGASQKYDVTVDFFDNVRF